jgi:hypothetical protein
LEQELRSIINKVRDMESKLQCKDKDRSRQGQALQAHSIEIDPADDDQFNSEVAGDDGASVDDRFALQVVDAYLAEVNNVDTTSSPTSWYLDSGASNHISGDSVLFSSMTSSSGTKVTSAGGQSHDVTGIGSIAIRLPNGAIQKISNVLYSKDIMKNLLSVGFLTNKRFRLEFSRNHCAIRDSSGHLVASTFRVNALKLTSFPRLIR